MQRLMRQAGLDVEVYAPARDDVVDHPSLSDDGLPLGDREVVVGRTGPPGSPRDRAAAVALMPGWATMRSPWSVEHGVVVGEVAT
jgi:hypothetical protein